MILLVKDAAKLSSLIIAESPLLLALHCLGHSGVLLFVLDIAIGLHRLIIELSLSLLVPF